MRAATAAELDREEPSVRGWAVAIAGLSLMLMLAIVLGIILVVDAQSRADARIAELNAEHDEYVASMEETVARNRGLYDAAMADLEDVRQDYMSLWARCRDADDCSTEGVLEPDEVPEAEPLPPDAGGDPVPPGDGATGAPPSQEQVAAAVAPLVEPALASYCAGGTGGRCQGPAGAPVPVEVVVAALEASGVLAEDLEAIVVAYCADGACQGAPSDIPGPPGEASTIPGPAGTNGTDGRDGRSVDAVTCSPSGWVVSYSDGTSSAAGECEGAPGVDGDDGADGADGRGVESMECVGDGVASRWVITYDDGTTQDAAGPCRVTVGVGIGQDPTP